MNSFLQYISEKVRNASGTLINPSTEEKQDSIAALIQTLADQGEDGALLLSQITKILTPLTIITSGSNRLNIDVNNVLGTIAQVTLVPTVTTVGTVNTVGNQTNMGGLNAFDLQYNMGHLAYATSIGNFQ